MAMPTKGTVVLYRKTPDENGPSEQVAIVINNVASDTQANLIVFDEISFLYKYDVIFDDSENPQTGTWGFLS
jgi:hypothetical protein